MVQYPVAAARDRTRKNP